MTPAQDKNEALFRKYIDPKKIMITDPCMGMRAGLAKMLTDMGARPGNIKLCRDYDTADQLMPAFKPEIVLCEYDLGPRCGLDLLQAHRAANPESKKSLFILITSNSSQSAVAQAAEEDIDNYILKPYTIDSLRTSIVRSALMKDYPTPYQSSIDEGKTALESGDYDTAIATFEKAMKLDPKPTLACFYHGQANLIKELLDFAQSDYNKGLAYNRIHYKCLTGLFDLLMKRSMHEGAYDVVKRIARYFPANPQRLTTVLRLAVMTNSFEDIERYYQIFTGIETRNEELIKYICAALVVCGKFYLRKESKSRALVLFDKASMYAGEKPAILREIVITLIAANMQKEASGFLKRFASSTHESPEFLAVRYVLQEGSMPEVESIAEGEKLLSMGIHDAEIYKILIKRCLQSGDPEKAQNLVRAAIANCPNYEKDFESAMKPDAGQG